MTKQELKNRIDEVINQPKGFWEFNDCKYFNVRVTPSDELLQINIVRFGVEEDYIQQILDNVPDEYRDHITGIVKTSDWSKNYDLTFDEPTQAKWNAEKEETIQRRYRIYHNI